MSIIEWKVYARNSRLRLPWVGCRWQSGRLESEQRLPERAAGAIGTEPLRSDSWRDAESSRRSSPTGADPRRLARPCTQTPTSHVYIPFNQQSIDSCWYQGRGSQNTAPLLANRYLLVIPCIWSGRTYQNLVTIFSKTIWTIDFLFCVNVQFVGTVYNINVNGESLSWRIVMFWKSTRYNSQTRHWNWKTIV